MSYIAVDERVSRFFFPFLHSKNMFWPRGYKTFSCSTQMSMNFFMLIDLKILNIANSFLLNIHVAEHEIFPANNISRENFMLS